MARPAIPTRLPWEDRWNQPNIEQLLKPMSDTHRASFQSVMEQLDSYELLRQSLLWYGVSWKWTLHYEVVDESGSPLETMAYLVPRNESPVICVPLSHAQIDAMPIKRLNKVIRDGIRSGKCALQTHWPMWTPTNNVEVTHIMDLMKRKYKHILAEQDIAYKKPATKS